MFPQCSLNVPSCNTKTDKNSLGVRSLDSSISAPSFRRYFAAASRCPSHLDPEKQGDHIQLTKIFVEPQHCFFEYASLLHEHHPVFKNPRLPSALSALSALIQFYQFSTTKSSSEKFPHQTLCEFPLAPPVLASDLAVSTAALLLPQGAKMR